MTKKIRKGVFETNSSSTHSITVCESNNEGLMDTSLMPDDDGVLRIDCSYEFGWEIETYNDASTKAAYCYIDNQGNHELIEMLINVLKQQTKADRIEFDRANDGYIDHQSYGTSENAFDSKESLRDFIFNPASVLRTDNDNH